MEIDSSLAVDLDFFYELALGTQPVGYRGVSEVREIEKNAAELEGLIRDVLSSPRLASLRRDAFGTTYCALGLVFYALGNRRSSRSYFLQAMKHKPGLILDKRMAGMYVRSLFRKEDVSRLKKLAGIVS